MLYKFKNKKIIKKGGIFMKKEYLAPSLDLTVILAEDVLGVSSQIVDELGENKDHLQGWGF